MGQTGWSGDVGQDQVVGMVVWQGDRSQRRYEVENDLSEC